MEDQDLPTTTHPMGELSNYVLNSQKTDENSEGIHCDTFAGLVHVEWDEQTPVTPIGQLIFFYTISKNI